VPRMIAALLVPFLTTTTALGDENDLIVFADGKEPACRVLLETDSKVVYRARNKTTEVTRAALKEVQSIERSLGTYLKRFEGMDPRDVQALSELALFAEANYLSGEAHNTWIRILTIDPVNEQAWTKLGGV